ncbi:hypothetical protein PtA15_1A508 [Puccinia triticina]|uniref:Uncharacterized protein n=1 Tax=Puccinia triticina TaxID=208348 RepID=A0ABY7C855_9BASI|nr:uncharacterized protein PtA15_1A508 [Puccinia triticina]WAQ81169.1 hypothetical protein PtA15_1A508 [Puccinia triticina]
MNPEHQRIWEQGDSVIQRFQRMATKYDGAADRRYEYESREGNPVKFTNDKLTRNEEVLDRLQSNLLPMLQFQTINLFESLNPLGLQQEPESKIQLISQNQLNVETHVDELRNWFDEVCSGHLARAYPSNDYHYQRSKFFRLSSLKGYILEASQDIGRSCRIAYDILNRAKRSTQPPSQQTNKMYHQGILLAEKANRSFQAAIECIKGSELDVAEKRWQSSLVSIDDSLRNIIGLVTPLTNSSPRQNLIQESVTDLAKSAIILIKVHKVFFAKFFSKSGAIRINIPCYTEMSSDQIASIVRSVEGVAKELLGLVGHLKGTGRFGDYITNKLRATPSTLQARFNPPMDLLLLYLIPLIPDTATQDDYREWLLTWSTQRHLSSENYLKHLADLASS